MRVYNLPCLSCCLDIKVFVCNVCESKERNEKINECDNEIRHRKSDDGADDITFKRGKDVVKWKQLLLFIYIFFSILYIYYVIDFI